MLRDELGTRTWILGHGSVYIAMPSQYLKHNLTGIEIRITLLYCKHASEDNGNTVSFHNSLKLDYTLSFEFSGYRAVPVAIEDEFNDYNKKKSHSSTDYLPPREFRRKLLNDESFREGCTKKVEI